MQYLQALRSERNGRPTTEVLEEADTSKSVSWPFNFVFLFIRPFKKLDILWEYLLWAASTGFPLSKLKSFYQVFIKLSEYVGVHNVSTKFYNQPNPPRHCWIMALELSKIRVSAL